MLETSQTSESLDISRLGSRPSLCGPDVLLRRQARFAGHAAREVGADAGYASQDSYAALASLKTTALIPPQPAAQHQAAQAARERMRTPAGRDAAIDRQTHAEGAIAELKHHGMGRSRCRGTRKTQLQLLAAATAINLKRLLSAHTARADAQAHDHATNYPTITNLLDLLNRCLAEIERLATTDSSTGSLGVRRRAPSSRRPM
jgi:hypothetical protein